MSSRRLAELLKRVLNSRAAVLQSLYLPYNACPWYKQAVEEQVALRIMVQRLSKAQRAKAHTPP